MVISIPVPATNVKVSSPVATTSDCPETEIVLYASDALPALTLPYSNLVFVALQSNACPSAIPLSVSISCKSATLVVDKSVATLLNAVVKSTVLPLPLIVTTLPAKLNV